MIGIESPHSLLLDEHSEKFASLHKFLQNCNVPGWRIFTTIRKPIETKTDAKSM